MSKVAHLELFYFFDNTNLELFEILSACIWYVNSEHVHPNLKFQE